MTIEDKIRELITLTPHMSLATIRDGKPWVCEVHFAHDEDLCLYFVSKLTTRHCLDIAENTNVAGNIVKQHPLTEAPSGLYFEGVVNQIQPTEAEITRYCSALSRDAQQLSEQLNELNGRRMYKISVINWAVFCNLDGSGHSKHELRWSKK